MPFLQEFNLEWKCKFDKWGSRFARIGRKRAVVSEESEIQLQDRREYIEGTLRGWLAQTSIAADFECLDLCSTKWGNVLIGQPLIVGSILGALSE
jgi:hypothetical protein